MLCDSEQIGSEWTQRMMMMPIANISSGSTPSTIATVTAAAGGGSSCSTSSAKLKGVMLHQYQHQHHHQHQQQDLQQHSAAAAAAAALKCPRCDSTNTKFCYYNNYSLSQPRHFCKACKRYWTRGGTLRNVPVGGGCRKNKRVKKSSHQQQPSSAAAATSTGSATVGAHPLQQPPQSSSMLSNLATSATNDLSSFLYSDMNLAAFSTTSTAAYVALGLGRPIPSNQLSAAGSINNNLADLQQQAASFLNNDYSTSFGSQAASLLVSSLKQPKTAAEYQSLLPYDASANLGFLKDVKVEGDKYNLMSNSNIRTDWQTSYQFESNGASDASYLYWNSAMGGAGGWPDVANPSVAPLI